MKTTIDKMIKILEQFITENDDIEWIEKATRTIDEMKKAREEGFVYTTLTPDPDDSEGGHIYHYYKSLH